MTLAWERVPSWRDPRLPFIAILTTYVVLGITVLGFNRTPEQILLCVFAACALDVALHWILRRRLLFPLSAAITGMSLGILANYAHGLSWPLVPVFFAIASKYLFTHNDRHVFNPSLFGLVVGLVVSEGMISAAPAYQWGGSYAMAAFVVTAALALFVFRIGRNALILSFLGFYLIALLVRAWLLRWHLPPETLILGPLTSPAFYLFTFFMITDPATSPSSRRGQVMMSAAIVALDFLLHLTQAVSTLFYAGFIYFAARWLWLQRGMLRASLAQLGAVLAAAARPWGLTAAITAAAWLGYQQMPAAHLRAPVPFKLIEIPAAQSGVGARPSRVLEEVDPRLAHVSKWLLSVGDAVAVADADGDGLQDIFLTYPLKDARDRAALYRNRGGFRFERVPLPAMEKLVSDPARHGLPSGALWFDYDNDGDSDLLVLMSFGEPRLLQNRLREEKTLAFRDVTERAGAAGYITGVAVNAIDIDRDGRLDVIIGNASNPYLPDYAEPTRFNIFKLPAPQYPGDRRMFNIMHRTWHDAANGGENVVLVNRGARFERVEAAALGLAGRRWTLAIGTGDLNGDGWTDLYLANDFGPDQLYLNEAGRGFRPLTGRLVGTLGRDTYKGMNASIADMDNNGYADIYVSNVHEKLQPEGSLLWMNRGTAAGEGAGAFRNEAAARNALNERRFGWGAAVGDLDRDGRLDIVQANGMVDDSYDKREDSCPDYWYYNEKIALTGPDVHGYADRWADLRGRCIFPNEHHRVYLNLGRYFVDVGREAGVTRAGNARGAALVDLDNDGDLDLVMTHQFAPASIYRNDASGNDWLGIELAGGARGCNRDALGSRVTIEYELDGRIERQWREAQASNGFSAQGDRRLLFGLGAYGGPVRVSVHWCGADVPVRYTLAPGRYHRLVQEGA